MDLAATILGLLSWKSLSGYDLKRIISDSEVFYWSGNNNQIYKNLIEMQKAGLVTYQVQAQESLPAKKIYSLTESGLEELRRSLLADAGLPEVRKGLLIHLAWAEILSDDEILGLLEKYEAEIEHQLRMRQASAARTTGKPGRSPRERYLWQQIDANGISTYQTELDWVRQTKQAVLEKRYLEGSIK